MKTKAKRIADMTEVYSKFDDKTKTYIDKILMEEGPYQLDLQIAARACVFAGTASTALKNAVMLMNGTRVTDGKNVEDMAVELLTISRIFSAMVTTYINDCGLSSDIIKTISRDEYEKVTDGDLQAAAHILDEYIAEFKKEHPNITVTTPADVLYPDPKDMS